MSEKKTIRAGAVCLLVSLLAALFFTACSSKATNAADKIELGQKYLTELNYTEAVASFTEAIKLDPDNIQAYMGRAEAYMALGEYDKALADYSLSQPIYEWDMSGNMTGSFKIEYREDK